MQNNQNWFHSLPAGTDLPSVVHAIIEIPKGKRNKYEIDKQTGLIRLDRYLYSASHYPGDYGIIPQTLAEDGDPLDILVMVNEPTFSGCLIETRVVGMFKMVDRGDNDFKIFGVPNSDPLFAEFKTLEDVPQHFLREVAHFFGTYKQLEGVEVKTLGWTGIPEAQETVEDAVARYQNEVAKE